MTTPETTTPGSDAGRDEQGRERRRARSAQQEGVIPRTNPAGTAGPTQTTSTPGARGPAQARRRPRGASALLEAGVDEVQQDAPAQPGGARPIPRVSDRPEIDLETGPDPAQASQEPETPQQRAERLREDPLVVADSVFEQVDGRGVTPVQVSDPPDEKDTPAVLEETRRRGKAATKGFRKGVKDATLASDSEKDSPVEQADRVMGVHDHYSQLMVLNCVKPLTQNVGPHELIESATALAVLWSLSPRVQDLMMGYRDKIDEALRTHRTQELDANGRTKLGASSEEMRSAQAKAKREDQLLKRRTDATLKEGHEVFGVDGAAETLMGMDEALYEKVRMGSDYVQERKAHDDTVDVLLGQWQKQGLSPTAIKAAVWEKIGTEAATDPAVASRYWSTFRGDLRPSDRGVDGSWDGRWVLPNGRRVDPSGSALFPVRMPLSPDQHLVQLSSLIETDLTAAAAKGPEALREVMLGHRAAWGLCELEVTGGKPGTVTSKTIAMGDGLAAVGRAQAGFMAMVDDGIHPDLRQAVAAGALTRAQESFASQNPEAMAAFSKAFPEGITDADLADFTARAERVGTAFPQGPIIDSTQIDNPALTAWQESKVSAGATLPEPVTEYSRQPAEPDSLPEALEALGHQGETGWIGPGLRPEPHPDHRPTPEQIRVRRGEGPQTTDQEQDRPVVPRETTDKVAHKSSTAAAPQAGARIPREPSSFLGSPQLASASTTDSDRGGRTDRTYQGLTWAPTGQTRRPQGLPHSRSGLDNGSGSDVPSIQTTASRKDHERARSKQRQVDKDVAVAAGQDDPTTPETEGSGTTSEVTRMLRTTRANRVKEWDDGGIDL